MLKNYFITAWRAVKKNRAVSLLNIIGLSAGLTCFIFIFLWVNNELSYDKFNVNYDRIFRLTSHTRTDVGTVASAQSAAPMAMVLKKDYPEVEHAVRLKIREEIITVNGQQVLQPGILLTEPSFFDIFSYHLTHGDINTALSEPYSIVLTASTAKKYFGNEDPMGRMLLLNMYDSTGYGARYKVTGVMPDPPENAHFTFNMLASFKTFETARPGILTAEGWADLNCHTYVLLKKGVDYRAFSGKIAQFRRPIYTYGLQALGNIHLHSSLKDELAPTGSIAQVYVFSLIGVMILLLAAINYTNLTTARSAARAKEVGVKKVIGMERRQLVLQFLTEAVIAAVAALLISMLLTYLLQPFFRELTGRNVSLLSSPRLIWMLIGITLLLGLLSGIYPAFILSSFKPVEVLKGSFSSGDKGILLRKILVVSQFVVTISLITGIVIIYAQMSFIRNRDLGYHKEGLIFLKVNGNTDVMKGISAFKNELKQSPFIYGMATSNSLIVGGLSRGNAQTVDAGGHLLQVNTTRLRIDSNYFSVYGIRMVAGRGLRQHSPADSVIEVILNETAVRKIGWSNAENALGKPFRLVDRPGTVVGIVKDFHYSSLEQTIEPLAIYSLDDHFSRITLKVDMGNANSVISLIEKSWKKHFPSALFEYNFVSEQLKAQYLSEERFSRVFFYFSLLSVIIACLGLYGLIAQAMQHKIKEIGIRKVLGASTKGLVTVLSTDFLRLVLLAGLIAVPISWYAMNGWLKGFAYRVQLSWWMFAAGGLLVVMVSLLTICTQTIKAALMNPVSSLRRE